jgi:hypothetical protein
MRPTLTILVVVTALGGCNSSHQLAKCHGPLVVLNTDKWQPTPTEVVALEKVCPEDR